MVTPKCRRDTPPPKPSLQHPRPITSPRTSLGRPRSNSYRGGGGQEATSWLVPGVLIVLLNMGLCIDGEPRRQGTGTDHVSIGGGPAKYRRDFMEDSCDCPTIGAPSCTRYNLPPVPQGAGHVSLSKEPEFYSQFNCQFTIQAPRDHRIQLSINNFSIPETKDCVAGILRVFDGIPANGGQEMRTFCGSSVSERLVQSKTDILTLYYYQGPDILWEKKSFNVTYTYVHTYKPSIGLTCNKTTEYVCANKLCIASGLKCDGFDNCGDGSEELLDVHVCGSTYNKSDPVVGVTVGIVVGVILALSLLAAFTCWARRRAGPFFTDAQLQNNVENGDDDIPPVQDSDLSAPDLTRDLIDRQRPRSTHQEEVSANGNSRDGQALNLAASNDLDGPPPSYSSLFPDLV